MTYMSGWNQPDNPDEIGIEDMDFDLPPSVNEKDPTTVCLPTIGLSQRDANGEEALHPIITTVFSIGRHKDCNLVLNDTKVSRRHASISLQGDDFYLEDNGSSNGTLLNGIRIAQSCILRPGDVITIGGGRLTFVRSEPAEH